uniref:Microtubule-associated protein futsch n=1 Tax=Anisakis simplex TaxID=6269 RepID=A0A0M3JHW9_ANISI
LSSKCIDITKKVVTDEENDEKISSTKSKSGKQDLCEGTTHSVLSVQPSMALNRQDDDGVNDSKSREQTALVGLENISTASAAVSVESNPSSSVLVSEKPSEQLSKSLIMEQVKEPTPRVASKTLVELSIESSVTSQHDVQPEKPVDDVEEESVEARQIEVPKRVSRVKKDADNMSMQHLPVVKSSKESVPEEAISIAANVKDDSRQKLVSKDDRTQKTLKQSPSVPSQTKSRQTNVRKSIDETVTDAGKREDSGVGS